MNGQIIIVSGTSGAGKSTTCDLYAKRSDDFYLRFGIDQFMGGVFPSKFGHHGECSSEGYYREPLDQNDPEGTLRWQFAEKGWRAVETLHEWVATASRNGCNIVVDHLMMTDPPMLQDCIWRLEGLPVLFVCVKPPYEVLMNRVATRNMEEHPEAQSHGDEGVKRAIEALHRLRPWFYETVYANDCYDLVIDTTQHNPDAVCDLIDKRLAEGPGTAFDTLRQRYQRPF